MIDISDGLAADLHHICAESKCGAVLKAAAIPITEIAKQMNDGRSPLDHALGDGEDFELLLAVSASDGQWLEKDQPLRDIGVSLYHIGECVSDGVWLEHTAGKQEPLAPMGYVHEME